MPLRDQQVLETMHDIGGLLFRRVKGELSEAEHIQLDQWLIRQDPESRQFFEDCTDLGQIHAALNVMYQFDMRAAYADLERRLGLEPLRVTPVITASKPAWRWYRYLMAACIIVLISGVGLFFLLHKKNADVAVEPVTKRFKNDIAPGGEKAILQLSDGRTIVLDKASNGELAKQGSTKVLKLDNGQLAYHAAGGAHELLYNTISTPRGGQYQVILPDGSKVWLNTSSALKFPTSFSGKERVVELTGEAYFEIAKNKDLPFIVRTTSATGQTFEIDVLGTEFDVMAYGDETHQTATLVNGSIKVASGHQDLTLKPGDQASTDKANTLALTSGVNVEEITAWKEGRFQFENADIESIMRQVARWYDIEVEYKGKIDQRFRGKIPQKVNISTLLQILESTGRVHFKIDGKKVTVMP